MNKEKILAKMKDLMAKQQGLCDTAALEGRDISEGETQDFEAWQKDINALKKQLEMLESMETNSRYMNEPATAAIHPVTMDLQKNNKDDGGFKNFGEFICAVRFGDRSGRLGALETKDMDMGTGSAGGYAIPEQFREDILKLNPEGAIVRPRANVIPAGTPPDAKLTMPALDQGAANGVYGGVTVQWIGEGETKPQTEPKLTEVSLEPHEVAAHVVVTDKLLRNWESASSFISGLLKSAIIGAEDYAFLRGDGNGKPTGVINCPGAVTVKRKTANKIEYSDIVAMMSRLHPDAIPIWIGNPSTMPEISTMQDGNGRYVFINGDTSKSVPATLGGYPLKYTCKTPVLGTKGDLMLVDLRYYLIKDGSGPFVAASEHVHFVNNKTVVKCFWHVDGKGWLASPLTLEDGQTKVSPFTVLDIPQV